MNLIADKNDILFEGNTDDNGSCAIYAGEDFDGAGKIHLFVSEKAKITFNDKIKSVSEDAVLYINEPGKLSTAGTIILYEDMSDFSGDVNFYAGTVIITEKGKWFTGSTTIDNATMNVANNVIEEIAFKNLQINNKLNLSVDADLKQEKIRLLKN